MPLLPGMEKTLMPADTTAAPDSVESRFTNRNENSTRTELQSKFVAKEVYQVPPLPPPPPFAAPRPG